MNDQQLEGTLRATLAARADTVAHGPGWDASDELIDTSPHSRSRRVRWIAPLAAAAVVLLVVGGVFVFRSSDHPSPTAAAAPQLPIPAGMKAVDALGIEIFVPTSYRVDSACGAGAVVLRPLPQLETLCPATAGTVVSIEQATGENQQSTMCLGRVEVDAESACVTSTAEPSKPPSTMYAATWPKHNVTVSIVGASQPISLLIIESVHAAPVDRNGCAATNQSLRPSPAATSSPIKNVPDPASIQFDSELLPFVLTRSMSVCWYIENRLVASALLGQAAASTVMRAADGMPSMWPYLPSRATLPSCDSLAATDGVLLTAHTPGRADVTAVADFAACNGQRTTRSATAAYLTTSDLADAIASTTGIPIRLDYSATR